MAGARSAGEAAGRAWHMESATYRWRRILPAASISLAGYGVFAFGWSGLIAPISRDMPSLPHSIVPLTASVRSSTFVAWNLLVGNALVNRSIRTGIAAWVCLGVALTGAGVGLAAGAIGADNSPSVPLLYLTLGVAPGLGTAIFYMAIFPPTLAWFADRKGLAAGVLGLGQGVGALVCNSAAVPVGRALRAPTLLLLWGGLVCALWMCGCLVRWPPRAQPASRADALSAARAWCGDGPALDWRGRMTSCARAAPVALMWVQLTVGMMSGFGIFHVLEFWLEAMLHPTNYDANLATPADAELGPTIGADAVPAADASQVVLASAGVVAFVIIGRPAAGVLYDRLGAHRFFLVTQSAQLLAHALLASHLLAARRPSAALAVPLVGAILFCWSAAMTAWAPLTLDLLCRPDALSFMIVSIPSAQTFSGLLMGALLPDHGPLGAMRAFIAAMGLANVSSLLLYRQTLTLLRATPPRAPLSAADGSAVDGAGTNGATQMMSSGEEHESRAATNKLSTV